MMPGTYPSAPGTPELVRMSSKQIFFTWQEPFDNGGSKIDEYEMHITRHSDSQLLTKTIVNSLSFDFNVNEGLVSGYEYRIKLRARNFFTNYYSLGINSPWSPEAV